MRFVCALLSLSVLAAFAGPEDDIVAGVDGANILDNIKYLSGATSSIKSRYSPDADTILAQNWLKSYFEGLGYQVTLQDWGPWNGYQCADNVIATKPGPSGQYMYVICAHYDSTSGNPWNTAPGADDNASGTATVMEAARLLASYPTEYTIEFICFSGEEQGLIGSDFYTRFPGGKRWLGAINLDMTGYAPDPNHEVYVGSTDTITAFNDFVTSSGEYYNPGRTFVQFSIPFGASDNYPFYDVGVPEVIIIEGTPSMIWGGYNPYYHSTGDTWNHLNAAYMEDCARAAIGALASLANVSNGSAVVMMTQYVGDLSNVTIELERRNPGSTIALDTHMVTLDSSGVFEFPDDVPAGTWDFAVKTPGWLRVVAASVPIPTMTGASFHLVPGDASDDNLVDLLDMNSVLADFGGAGVGTDIDGSGMVDLNDLNLVLTDFGQTGDD